MADIATELAARSGVSPDLAKKAMGAILAFLKDKIPAEAFAKISNVVPETEGLMTAATAGQGESGGGVVGAVTGAVSKLFGVGTGSAALVSKLTQLGLAPEQVQGFLKSAVDFLKDKLPADVLKQITGLFPS
jgi:phage-related tail fiber protein